MKYALIKGGLLGGLVMFLWGNVSWAVLHWHQSSLRTFKDEAAVAKVLSANAPYRGVYVLPNPLKPAANPGGESAYAPATGPRAFVAYDDRALDSMARPLGGGLLIQLMGGFCLAWLLVNLRLGYWGRALSGGAAGLFTGIVADLPNWNWWSFSTNYTAVSLVDHTLAGLLAGFVIAWAAQEPKKAAPKA